MCRLPFQAQISVTIEHIDLSLYKQISFTAKQSVNAVFLYNYFERKIPVGSKIVYQICYDIDISKTFVVACITSTNDKGITDCSLNIGQYSQIFFS